MRPSIRLAMLLLIALVCRGRSIAVEPLIEKAPAIVAPVIEAGSLNGVAVGIIEAGAPGQKVAFGLGKVDDKSDRQIAAETIFEIGSISKVFTCLLLADLVERGVVKLDDPVGKYLPEGVQMPSRDGRQITLVDLATHSSGLPRMPGNFKPADPTNPYADYTPELLHEFLNKHKPRHAPGERVAYSNLGMGLLGHALARAAGKSYEDLLKERILTPLGMTRTSVALSEEQRTLLAGPHDADGQPEHNWDLNVLAGAGGIRSNVDDMLKFLAAELGLVETPLAGAIKLTQIPRNALGEGGGHMGLGWHLSAGEETIWHNGQTGGYHSFAAIRPREKVAVVVLANTASDLVDQIGNRLAQLAIGREAQPLATRKAIELSDDVLDRYVGKYEIAAVGAALTIKREGSQLWAQLSFQPRAKIFPESETEFFYRIVDAQLTFERDAEGKTTGLALHQNGRDLKGVKQE